MSDNTKEQPLRINKYLTLSGVESRRVADELITQGRVSVNGKIVEQPGIKVEPGDFVKLDDKRVQPLPITTILLNKPRDFICSRAQQGETDTIYTLLPPTLQHLTYAGRLDSDSEGLVIMSNDGDLIQKITHPTEGIEKEYWVTLDQSFDNSVLTQLLRGVTIAEGFAKAKYVMRASSRRAHVVLEQGMKRQIRQMFACLGLRVNKLVRVRIGSLWGGDLEPGRWSQMTEEDIKLALTNPPASKDWFSPEIGKGLVKHKPGRVGGPLHPGQIAEKSEGRRGVREFSTKNFNGQDRDDRRPPSREWGDRDRGFRDGGGRDFGGDGERGFRPRGRDFGGDRGFRPRRDGDSRGFNKDREGGFGRDREGGFRPRGRDFGGDRGFRPRRDGESRGFNKDRREGGFGGDREGGFRPRGRDFGGDRGFRPRRDGESRGFNKDREGGFGRGREGGFGGDREGGFRSRGRDFGGDRGFKPRRDGESRGFNKDRREGGFGGDREGGFRPRGRDFGGDRNDRGGNGFHRGNSRSGFGGFRGGNRGDR